MTTAIDKLNAGAGSQTQTSATGKNPLMLGQEDFLRLMTTQLTTQDPFKPVENTEMIAQMAQFSSVAGIAEMSESLKSMAEVLNPNRLTDAASWIGRSMLVASDIGTPLPDGSYAGEIALSEAASDVSISFVDATGAVVHSETFGEQPKGTIPFSWDGKDADGQQVGTGPLKLVVQATAREGGAAMTPATAAWTSIGGIQSPAQGGSTQLVTGLGLLTPDEAIRLA